MYKSGFQVELAKRTFYHDLDFCFFSFCTPELQGFMFSNEIKLKNETVNSTYQINPLSATQNIQVCLRQFFLFLPNSVCPLKLRNCPTRTNQWPTQSRILLPTAVNSECFRGRWQHLIMISLQWKNLYLLRNEYLQTAMKCGMNLILSKQPKVFSRNPILF